MVKHFLLILSAWLLANVCFAQPSFELNEVSIETLRAAVNTSNLTDSLYMRRALNESVGSLLAKRSGLQLLQYGATGSAIMARHNGLASAQTSVNWNGMPLASRSLGVCDLSMLPAAFFDEIKFVQNNAQSRSLGSTLGGSVELNKRSFQGEKNGWNVMVGSSLNSMLNQSLLLKTGWKTYKIQWSNAVLVEDNRNNFTYRDEYTAGKPTVSQLHNRSKQTAIYQQLGYVFPNRQTKAVVSGWWQWRHNQLPSLMGISKQSNAEQMDSVLRTMIGITHQLGIAQLEANFAWIDEWQRYTDKFNATDTHFSINSLVRIRQGIGTAQANWNPSSAWNFKGAANLIHVLIDNSNYAHGQVATTYPSFSGEASYTGGIHKWTAQSRFEKRSLLQPAFAYGIVWSSNWLRRKSTRWNLDTECNAQRKFRNPDFNELYWVPGGNPNLKAEQGYTGELSLVATNKSMRRPAVELRATGFVQHIYNWIQWTPTTGNIWSPQNVKEVWSNGVRSSIVFLKDGKKYQWKTQALYQYTYTSARFNGEDRNEAKELPYTTPHQVMLNADVVHARWDANINYRYYHLRYTDQNNTAHLALPAYGLWNASIGYRLASSIFIGDLQFGIENIMNTQYQQVRSYAMPGRVYTLSLKLQFKKNK